MSLELDERRRGMLAEMGIRLFAPVTEPVPSAGQAAGALVSAPRPSPASLVAAVSESLAAAPPRGAVASMDWAALADAAANCRACRLCEGRTRTVFGAGDVRAQWLIVGEAPGDDEEVQAEPFAGEAGRLLDNMLKAIGLDRRSQVYLANALKCRPPGNRNPDAEEVAQCEPFLRRQVELLRPRIILAMGRFAAQSLLGTTEPIGKLRGRAHEYLGVPVVVTFPPAYLLRNLPDKAKAWADLCLAQELMRASAT
jgi:uracil-DNA glycosylase